MRCSAGGRSATTSSSTRITLDGSTFSHHEEKVSKLLHTLLLLLQRIDHHLIELCWSSKLAKSVECLCLCLDQLVRCPLCVKDTLTVSSMIMVKLAQRTRGQRRKAGEQSGESGASGGVSSASTKKNTEHLVVSLFDGTTNWSISTLSLESLSSPFPLASDAT